MRYVNFLLTTLLALCASCTTQLDVVTIPQNEPVIRAVEKMPRGGGYSTRPKAHHGLSHSIRAGRRGGLDLRAGKAKPSYCSGATYHVLLSMVQEGIDAGVLELSSSEVQALMMQGQGDGIGIWGRWNSNGPGAAKLVKDLRMGINFESYEKAQAGDFMKIFWSDQIGKHEYGHLVVYLGTHQLHGEEYVKFWSSNQPRGYGVKSVPKRAIKWAVFTRITNITNIKNVDSLSHEDTFLSGMLRRSYSRATVRSRCAVQ
ncbi:hypothetical protein [Rubritalea profundi]|uniref:Peptidase C39-like domain-containing protein n=1 Tax=Rubritalea profundi TaxID=1658618 RepID=A0A2S7U180_9BACT|nr:hypothetical protein [Rubritalea profundi]PQJ27933.1 hypothetical protein BSZ32_05070 [Rubritalea profundi]